HQDEIVRLSRQLPALNKAATEALSAYSSSRVNRTPYPHEQVNARDRVKMELETHGAEVKRLRPLVEWDDGLKNATANAKAARKIIEEGAAEQRKLETKRSKIAGRLAELQREARDSQERARAEEREAARKYAAAMAAGDQDAEQQAEGLLSKAGQVLSGWARSQGSTAAVTEALTDELEKLDNAIDVVREQQKEARNNLFLAARYLWAARLDEASKQLVKIAAHLAAADKALGYGLSTDDLFLPLMAPGGARYMGSRNVLELRDSIGIEQLLAS
uniref:hypothetical protein n=1 Tax=Pseudomonas nitroreducens TaxID=46680 RepID=UPI002FE24B44